MDITDNGTVRRTRFDSVHELLSRVTAPCNVPDRMRSSIVGTAKFTGTDTLADAVNLARTGWDGGTALINQYQAEIAELLAGTIPVPQPEFGVTGQRIHMGRYLAGRPDCFVKLVDHGIRREAAVPKVKRIVFNITASGAVSTDTILRRGAALVVLVDTLERRRIRCQIDLVHAVGNRLNGDDALEYIVTVKDDREPVSLDKLAYFAAHASSLRRLMSALAEHESDAIRKRFGAGLDIRGGYGLPREATDRGDIYLGSILTRTDWGESFTLAWLRKELATQGIILEATP